MDERNERCRYTELMGREGGGGDLAVFIIPENCRYFLQNVSTSIFFQYYLADVEQCFKSFVATTATLSGSLDYSLTYGVLTNTLRSGDPSKICVINILRADALIISFITTSILGGME